MSEDRQSTLTIAPQNLGLLHPIGTPQVTPVHALAPGAQSLPSLMVAQPRDSLFPAGGGQQYLSQGPAGPIPMSQVIDPSLAFVPGTGAHTAFQQNLQRAQDVALATGPGQFGAYHGTGASFDQFLDEFMGTGEGAQTYGWGHYVAGAPGAAKTYQPEEGGHLLNVWVKPEHEDFLDWDSPLSKQEPEVQDKLKALSPNDYDPGISGQEFYARLVGEHLWGPGRQPRPGIDPRDEAKMLASKELDAAGIPGMRFLDQQSRHLPASQLEYTGSAELPNEIKYALMNNSANSIDSMRSFLDRQAGTYAGYSPEARFRSSLDFLEKNIKDFRDVPNPNRTYNYVVYDPKNIEITHRDGIPLTPVDHDPFAQ